MDREAVPTVYSFTRFRSRLEADWAATLDSHHIRWQYEPQQLTLPSGTVYVPDFWLPELGTWIEVKGPGVPRVEKAVELGESRACRCPGDCSCEWAGGVLVLIGQVGRPYCAWTDPAFEHGTEAMRINGQHRTHGHLTWASAHGPSAYFLNGCPNCGKAGFVVMRAPLACRACREPLRGGHLEPSGADELLLAAAYSVPAEPA